MSTRILLIQSDAVEARAVTRALHRSKDGPFRVDWVRTLSEGMAQLGGRGNQAGCADAGISAVMTDLFLQDSSGVATFDGVFGIAPQIPILVLVGSEHEELAKLAVKRGAQDYLFKDRLDDYLLPKALRNMIERTAISDALFAEKERAEVTLNSIGDAVMSTDERCAVSYLNRVAEMLTGWTLAQAAGRLVDEVFRIADVDTREPRPSPMARAMRENKSFSLTPNALLIRRDGSVSSIEDSAAPIHDRRGRVTGAVMVFRDVSVERGLSLRMAHLAQHDGLTDLPNRMLVNDRITQAITMAQRHGKQLAVLFVDIDRFKHVNDESGHKTGARLLQSVAWRLLACVRASDTVSRQGGDEFVILLGEIAHAQDAAFTAEKMLAVLSDPHPIEGAEIYVTASIGVVTYPMDGTSADSLIKNADTAMYRAKKCGRNNYQFYAPEMNVQALDRQRLESDLRHAVERAEMELLYQPKIDLRSGAITGVEALVRWRHANGRLLRPCRFISIAEESGLIVPIGRWVLREACRQARAWQSGGSEPVNVAVNVSTVELRTKNFVDGVRSALADTGLEAGHLELEITETFLMQDANSTARVLAQLKDIGVRLALDDFGTGYSSLSYLKRFPIDSLKIDHSFIKHLGSDTSDASIVAAVVDLGRNLRMRVVAEGVETEEQLNFLRRHRCPEAQGYYFSEPVIAEDMAAQYAQSAQRTIGASS